jgi:hypothetical protein
MKKIQLFIGLLIIGSFNIACQKDDDDIEVSRSEDTFTFGHFYGECMGEYCVEIFRIEDNKVFEDTNDNYPNGNGFYEGDFSVLLSSENYEQVMGLVADFPADLWSEGGKIIGQPDAGDWGGLYLEYKNGEDHNFWLLDQLKSNVPEGYHEFIDSVNAKIALLQP